MIERYQKNFDLFDRDHDELINFEECKELLTSVNVIWDDLEILEDLFNELIAQNNV